MLFPATRGAYSEGDSYSVFEGIARRSCYQSWKNKNKGFVGVGEKLPIWLWIFLKLKMVVEWWGKWSRTLLTYLLWLARRWYFLIMNCIYSMK